MTERKPDQPDTGKPPRGREEGQDASRETGRQIDDNQDDEGRDINDPSRVAKEINKTGH